MDFSKLNQNIYFINTSCVKGLQAGFSWMFMDRKCIVCSKPVFVSSMCPECTRRFLDFDTSLENRCSVCGRILVSEKSICTGCRSQRLLVHTDQVFPLHSYRLWNKKLLFEWKMADERTLSPVFAQAVHKALTEVFAEKDGKFPVIVPVPPRKGKIRRKGWDQIDELCRYLKRMYGCTIFSCLTRLTKTQQKKLDREERLKGKGKSYVLSRKFYSCRKKNQLPDTVILLDDVITTGVTVEGIAELLKEGGIKFVKVISLFIVD